MTLLWFFPLRLLKTFSERRPGVRNNTYMYDIYAYLFSITISQGEDINCPTEECWGLGRQLRRQSAELTYSETRVLFLAPHVPPKQLCWVALYDAKP